MAIAGGAAILLYRRHQKKKEAERVRVRQQQRKRREALKPQTIEVKSEESDEED